MNAHRFIAATVREALQRVREALGADALIVSNRPAPGGVEIVAMRHTEALPPPPAPQPTATSAAAADAVASDTAAAETRAASATQPAAQSKASAAAAPTTVPARAPAAAPETPAAAPESKAAPPKRSRPRAPASPAAATAPSGTLSLPAASQPSDPAFAAELASLRALVERGFATLSLQERMRSQPARARLFGRLVDAGFGAAQARGLADRLPDDVSDGQALAWLRGCIQRALRCHDPADDIVVRGGVYALVGPTGVGKTTTTAKLAARCALRFGTQSIALVTTDGYRMAAREQLRSFGKILGVDVHFAKDAAGLATTMGELGRKHLVLIDTIGASQRDRRVAETLSLLGGSRIERLLLLNAATQRETLDEVVSVYAPTGLTGVVVTKVDEAARVGGAVDVLLRHALPVHYVTNGQRVPEDIAHAHPAWLADLALPDATASPAVPTPREAEWLLALDGGERSGAA